MCKSLKHSSYYRELRVTAILPGTKEGRGEAKLKSRAGTDGAGTSSEECRGSSGTTGPREPTGGDGEGTAAHA